MQNPVSFYNSQIKNHTELVKSLYKTMSLLSILRLVVFLATVYGIYATFDNWQLALGTGVAGAAIFLFLLSRYTSLKYDRALHQRMVELNETELEISKGNFYERPDGSNYEDPKHFFSLDVDLFGKGSFFQFANRTTIKEGSDKLAGILLSNYTEKIIERQQAVKELASMPEWSQHYSAIAQGVSTEYSAISIITWLKDYKPFLKKFHLLLAICFSVLSVLLLILTILELTPMSLLGYWLLIGLGISAVYLKRISSLALYTGHAKDTFRQYALLLKQIENQGFKSHLLRQKQLKIATQDLSASAIFSKFSKNLDALDNRNNLISAVLGNGYFLWDIRQAFYIEKWISAYGQKVEDWFEVVTFFDAYNSLGNYAFNHQDFVYPEISKDEAIIQAKELGHPLLDAAKRIPSDLNILKDQFFIVTGANMAGKSTFLRTVGLHIIMANTGLPVCAETSSYTPVKLITSMRTTDSLTDDSSYFFSELTRLKFVVDTITESNYFVILDEILKGTNSTDKAIGSRKFVEKLVALSSIGIIATHDLSLTEIERELPAIKNYFFDAQITNDELYFDYILKQGVCQNMNASFLLKKMEIV